MIRGPALPMPIVLCLVPSDLLDHHARFSRVTAIT